VKHWTRSTRVRVLAAVNAGLALALATVWLGPAADAQGQPDVNRNRGTYLVIGGDTQGGNSDAIWVIDTANQEMVTLRWRGGQNQLEGIGYRDLKSDAQGVVNR